MKGCGDLCFPALILFKKEDNVALNKEQLRNLYRKRAARYDLSANLYYLIGFRENFYRKKAVAALDLEKGDTVVEIGCGTGLNFAFLQNAIGKKGRLVGVDLTDAMLDKARQRIVRNVWHNVDLVRNDAAEYEFPKNINGVISTFALTLIPEYEKIIKNASQSLAPGGTLVVADLKKPENSSSLLLKLMVFITRPFGVTLDLAERKPWKIMEKYFESVQVSEFFGGFAYIAVAKKD